MPNHIPQPDDDEDPDARSERRQTRQEELDDMEADR